MFWNSTEWGQYRKGMKPPAQKPATMPTSIWRRAISPNTIKNQITGKTGFFHLLKNVLQWIVSKLKPVFVAAR